ncbi:hypothetical protein HPC49_03395 [Pyxidicoccus fallax]|uniref:Uncharacterized protein n=1 Tax=Pyxidicoccus fallax TaxID=394095 RepID=A0A848LFG0_9BACT|nr:hypothetical protein [Pyxidicoccus fallax]NMO15763.1 hypothetical protein [Pyxidicoccus fallax]NPC77301.1 hypothetical protein [Pyxidicoccus fallax]
MTGTDRVGIAIVGVGGAVATTAIAGMELLTEHSLPEQHRRLMGWLGAGGVRPVAGNELFRG